jgi:hypothetical protein
MKLQTSIECKGAVPNRTASMPSSPQPSPLLNKLLANLPDSAYLRQFQILGEKEVTVEQAEANKVRGKGPRRARSAAPAIYPVSPATWWRLIQKGIAPAPHRLSPRTCGWQVGQIRQFLESQAAGG